MDGVLQADDTSQIPKVPASILKIPEDAVIPVTTQGMGSDLDNLSGSVSKQIQGMFPKVIQAEKDKAEAQKQQSLSEEKSIESYRQQIKGAYEENKPGKVDFGSQPKSPDNNPIQQFGSLASMIGIFASAFTKKPIVNALNASAAAMNAQRQGDQEKFKEAYQEWQDQVDIAMKRHSLEVENLNQIMDLSKEDQSAALAQLKAYGVANQSDAASVLSQLGDWEEIGKYVSSMETAQQKLAENKIKMDELATKQQEEMRKKQVYDDSLKSNIAAGLPKSQAEANALLASEGKQVTSNNVLDDEDVSFMAKRFLAGDKSAVTGLGYGNTGATNRVAVQKAIRKESESMGMTPEQVALKLQEYQASTRALGSVETAGGKIAMFAYEADKLASQALDASDKVSRGNFVPANKLFQMGQEQISDPNLKRLQIALMGLKNAWAKAVNGGGQPHQGDKTSFDQAIYQADGPKALKAGLEQMKQEVKAAEESPESAMERIKSMETGQDSNSGEEEPEEDNIPHPPSGFEVQ